MMFVRLVYVNNLPYIVNYLWLLSGNWIKYYVKDRRCTITVKDLVFAWFLFSLLFPRQQPHEFKMSLKCVWMETFERFWIENCKSKSSWKIWKLEIHEKKVPVKIKSFTVYVHQKCIKVTVSKVSLQRSY